jgi:hypothetical protein
VLLRMGAAMNISNRIVQGLAAVAGAIGPKGACVRRVGRRIAAAGGALALFAALSG